jgi:FkbM family methyltransferase
MAHVNPIQRAVRGVQQRTSVFRGRREIVAAPDSGKITWVGTQYGGWPLPDGELGPDSVVFLAGLGEDASFDLKLIEDFGCEVHAFDPVPEAVAYGKGVAERESRFHFHPFGLWSTDGTLSFYDNPNEGFVSRSATDMHGTGTHMQFEVRSIPSLLAEFGKPQVDLCKLSVEGSEYELIDAILADRPPIRILCVEFAQPAPYKRVEGAVRRLEAGGWTVAYASIKPFGWKMTFRAPSSPS